MKREQEIHSWEYLIRQEYELPDIEGIDSYYFSLDGGGRDLITSALEKYSVHLMLEIGCYLCGSTIQWLESKADLKVVGVDPWAGDFASHLDRYKGNPVFDPCFNKIDDKENFITSVRKHGPYASAMANIQQFGHRFFPVRAFSPNVLNKLKNFGFSPQLIYFDSNKLLDDLDVCQSLFPNAILSGDDWTWGAEQGFPVQKAVKNFCYTNSLSVESRHATWIIRPT